jgi:hypothetical protein
MLIFQSLVGSMMMNLRPLTSHQYVGNANQPIPRARVKYSEQVPISHYQKGVVRKIRRPNKWYVSNAANRYSALISACRVGRSAIALLARTMIDGSSRRTPVRPKALRGDYASDQSSTSNKIQPKVPGRFGMALVLSCVAFTSMCIVIAIALFIQVRGLKSEVASSQRELIATNNRLVELEKTARAIANVRSDIASGGGEQKILPAHIPIALNKDEIQFLREFIKVAPPQAGAQPRLKVGDELPNLASLPIPDAVAESLPKLQGAKFAIDQNGAIVISGAGSGRVDVVVAGTPLATQK